MIPAQKPGGQTSVKACRASRRRQSYEMAFSQLIHSISSCAKRGVIFRQETPRQRFSEEEQKLDQSSIFNRALAFMRSQLRIQIASRKAKSMTRIAGSHGTSLNHRFMRVHHGRVPT